MAHDFARLNEEKRRKGDNTFLVKSHREGEEDTDLVQWLNDTIAQRARELGRQDTSLKTLAMQSGNLLVAAQNLNLQRWVGWLTIAAVVLAVVSAIDPAEKLWKKLEPAFKTEAVEGVKPKTTPVPIKPPPSTQPQK